MKWFYDLKVQTKLLLSFILVAVLAGVVGYLGIISIQTISAADNRLYEHMTQPIATVTEIASDFQQIRVAYRDIVLARNEEEQQKYNTALKSFEQKMEKANAEFEKSIISPAIKDAFKECQRAHDAFVPFLNHMVEVANSNKKAEAVAYLRGEAFINAANTERDALSKLIELEVSAAKATSEENTALGDSALKVMLFVLGLAVVAAIGLGYLIARVISNPVRELADQAEKVSTGDLTVDVVPHSKDEVGLLAASFKKMIENLRDTIGRVGEASAAVASASTEISSSAEEMAAGAQEQTSQAGEVASAVEEMTKTIIENSKNAGDTARTAKKAKEAAEQGGFVVEETVTGMKRIADFVNRSAVTVRALGKSSDQIGEIIGVIDDIADQTNLLALNAAIEAARAGDQGRGFAVVADEVRKLAERTTKATKEIAGMIKTIQGETAGAVAAMEEGTKEVGEGIKLADRAGASLKDIVTMIQNLTDMVSQIAAASEEQSSASEQISKNVDAISSVTSQSASATQQIARAAEDLNRMTENMQEIMGNFTLGINDKGMRSAASKGVAPGAKVSAAHKEPKSGLAVRENGAIVPHG
ncbi:MAG TPA: methyl-accepting chemotaxis protein [Bacteroidota bacterium]|nr:methyl-accepting chemotaxis protein [Bacteroidota bacterium]